MASFLVDDFGNMDIYSLLCRTYIGLALRNCVQLGLHSRISSLNVPIIQAEIQKRLFWTCYILDRQISIALGRPVRLAPLTSVAV